MSSMSYMELSEWFASSPWPRLLSCPSLDYGGRGETGHGRRRTSRCRGGCGENVGGDHFCLVLRRRPLNEVARVTPPLRRA